MTGARLAVGAVGPLGRWGAVRCVEVYDVHARTCIPSGTNGRDAPWGERERERLHRRTGHGTVTGRDQRAWQGVAWRFVRGGAGSAHEELRG